MNKYIQVDYPLIMKSNPYFRAKTSAPTLDLESTSPNSLASLMGRFRNEGQNQEYCLRAKPDTAGPLNYSSNSYSITNNNNANYSNYSTNSLLGSKYEGYEQGGGFGKNYQTLNKENVYHNPINRQAGRFNKQLTPTRRQQGYGDNKERGQSRSPINSSNYSNDNGGNKFIFKAKENKTLGNLIQLAENYQQQQQSQLGKNPSPSKVFIGKKYSNNSNNENSSLLKHCKQTYPENPHSTETNKLSIELSSQALQQHIQSLKSTLVSIAQQSLPRQALQSSINIQIQDFLNLLIPSRSLQSSGKLTEFKKKQSSVVMQTSQGMPVNFSFDISYQQFSKGVTDGESEGRMESSEERNVKGDGGEGSGYQSDYLLCEQGERESGLLTAKTEQMLRQL